MAKKKTKTKKARVATPKFSKKTKKCTCCGENIHPKRLEILPNTTKCVKCSSESKKAGVTITKGEGDHTYTETIIMDSETFQKYQEEEYKTKGIYFPETDDTDPKPEEESNG